MYTTSSSQPSGAYPTVALPTVGSSYASSSSPYYTGAGGSNNLNGGGGTNYSSNANGRLSSPSATLGLRKRDAVAIFTCLFLLRLAFTPSNTAITGSGGLINFSDSSISASMELAFYSPFQSFPPSVDRKNKNHGQPATERTARPVPLDIDGDGVVESMVVPVFLKRSEVRKERELELEEKQKKKRTFVKRMDVKLDDSVGDGWSDEGSWGLRILNLKPLHRSRESDQGEDIIVAGPFAPRTIFLSPLREADKTDAGDNGNKQPKKDLGEYADLLPTGETYPVKLLHIQIPVRRTRLGDEEKSRQRHKTTSNGSYGKNDAIPPRDDPKHAEYDRTRHYFCGRDWHHAAQSCHKHCPGGLSSECGEGETCYADTPCDVHIEPGDTTTSASNDVSNDEESTTMALTKSGTLPGIATVWSDGSVSLHVITADVTPSTGSDGHRTKRAKQKSIKPELDLRQLWRVYPLQPNSGDNSNSAAADSIVDFVELGIAFESGAIFGSGTEKKDDDEQKRYGDNGAILLGGRYTLLSKSHLYPLRVSFHALDAMTGMSLLDLKGNHEALNKKLAKGGGDGKDDNKPAIPLIHTTSSARRRSHLPTMDVLDPELDNENAFVEGDDVMTSEECMAHFRTSVLDHESGALPHEFWDDGEFGSISVGRFDRGKKFAGRRRPLGKKGSNFLLNKRKGGPAKGGNGPAIAGLGMGKGRQSAGRKDGPGSSGRARGHGTGSGARPSWQSDLLHRAVPRRLIQQQKYNARHPHHGKPNVVLFHGREGLAVLSLKNGRPVCHVSLTDRALYADMDADGAVDIVQVVTSPESLKKSSAAVGLMSRIAKEASQWRDQPDAPVICHALVTSGLPPREEVFTAPLCLGGPVNPNRPHLSAAPPLLVEGSMGYGNDVVFAMNNGVVVRYDFNGREVWRKKGGLKDGTPSWYSNSKVSNGHSSSAFLGRIQFGNVREAHSSVSASSHRNQHRPGSPVRPILLSGEDGAALISPASGRVLFSVVYPQSVTSQPLLADMDGDGTDDLLVVSNDAVWGYRVVVETGRSGGFTIVVVTLLIGVALAALVHKTSHVPGQSPRRSTDA